ncbi:hypothetical protein DSL72_007891 [Monilinia vaccinii-corymbosi]|uniref:Pectinesterase n=1 Tax=Monilinia vaccinii-corymbosi TaxID=61207 RepID=A0A8A3PID4_9HELO|nr:hypothetical protein DSL72_007891 [Monilinia vaccinii-corymbosi]
MRYFAIFSLVASMLGSVSAGPVSRATTSYARTSPPPGAVVVDQSGAIPGSHKTFQAGVDALSDKTTKDQYLFIAPGTYFEQVYLRPLASHLTIQGYTTDARSYEENKVTLTYNLALIKTTTDDLTATFRAHSSNTKMYNLNIKNTFGHVKKGGQNLALSSYAGDVAFYGCQFWGYQDTILADYGVQLFAKCLILGAVDFIFGTKPLAWFEKVDIRTIAKGSITASGRAAADVNSWFVINNSNINMADPKDQYNSTKDLTAQNSLGRPWGPFARVCFQNSYLGKNIKPEGWSQWSDSNPNIDNPTFVEYHNSGPGSILQTGPRANFSSQLPAALEIKNILGADYTTKFFYDASYMS